MTLQETPKTNIIPKSNIISRKEWNAMPPKETYDMTHPVRNVIFTIDNIGKPCSTKEECMSSVKHMQNYYSDLGLEDIPYSFVIGNDGNVYEGRGWKHKPGPNIWKNMEHRDHTLDIAIICGHNESNPMVKPMVGAAYIRAKEFVEHGIELGIIDKDYKYSGFDVGDLTLEDLDED